MCVFIKRIFNLEKREKSLFNKTALILKFSLDTVWEATVYSEQVAVIHVCHDIYGGVVQRVFNIVWLLVAAALDDIPGDSNQESLETIYIEGDMIV